MIPKYKEIISVVVPVYKVEKYLYRCIDSILSQTFEDFKLILVDDGSPDNCGKICDEYAEKDKRITVIHKKNGGLSDARNAGIDWAFKNSNSEWITFIDSDDWIDSRYLESLLNYAVENHVQISVCDFLRITDFTEQRQIEKISGKKWITKQFFTEKNLNFTIACGKLYRKSLFSDIRFPKGKIHEDEFVTYKILFQCSYVVFVETPLYYYFINNESITGAKWTPEHLVALEAFDEKLIFFRDNHLSDVYCWQLKHYIFFLCDCCKQIENDEEYTKYYLASTRKKLKLMLKELEKVTGSKLSKDKEWIYDIAYPFERKIYWIIKSIVAK